MKTFEERDREAWEKSEYSKKGSSLYISYAKWKRLSGRICRVKAEVHMMGKMGEYYVLKLDTSKCDAIGMTRKSLDKWMRDTVLHKPYVTYWIAKWNIMAA